MDSLNQPTSFSCHSNDNESDIEFSGKLDILIHHARNLHNICIYDNQDVYAKFSLTYNPDEHVSTGVVIGGGKNPEFEQKVELKVKQIDGVLKCEIWMLSRARNLLEDQLLGFTLVPISHIVSQGGKLKCHDFSLSSTDLFHSPAGTIQLSLSLSTNFSCVMNHNFIEKSSISSEVVLLDRNEYSRIQFPDINADAQDKVMVSQYFSTNSDCLGSFLHLGTFDLDSIEKNEESPIDDHKKIVEKISDNDLGPGHQPRIPSKVRVSGGRGSGQIGDNEECKDNALGYTNSGFEFEQTAMQKQIVDMYMKSMHQFTESLANMKLPMELDLSTSDQNPRNLIKGSSDLECDNNKKDGSRVFYGSRAFF
ncbi:unnamed protein product [Amaranthus hypochondriacus]